MALIATGLILAAGLTACGGSSGGTADPGANSSVDWDNLTMDQIYQGAKKEGELVLYSAQTDQDLAVATKAFDKKYPGIKIVHVEQPAPDSLSKLTAAAKAGKYEADVLDAEQNTMYQMTQEKLLQKYTPLESKNLSSQWKYPTFTGYRIQIKPISYNTDKVSASEAPKSYNDLLDPKWKGRICASASDVSTFSDMLQDWGESAGVKFWKGLYENGVRFISGEKNLAQAIVSGECPVSVTANVHTIAADQADGAPVAWVKTPTMYGNFVATGILVKAPHPYAARLWANYVLTADGQKGLVDNYRIPVNPDVKPKEPELVEGTYKMIVAGDDAMENFNKYNTLYYQTTGRPVVAPEG